MLCINSDNHAEQWWQNARDAGDAPDVEVHDGMSWSTFPQWLWEKSSVYLTSEQEGRILEWCREIIGWDEEDPPLVEM